jgi:precorrin-2 dehydrogenase/sirohydrochlorin ferrochelatase
VTARAAVGDAPLYPVNLRLEGLRCLVVGGGSVAAGKVDGLLAVGAVVHVVAPDVSDTLRSRAGVTFEERPYAAGEAAGYRFVVAATGDPAVNEAVHRDGDAAGIWVNAVDDPAHGSCTLPAVVRRGPIVVAVSTGGQSPAMARWLRQRLDAELEPELGELAALVGAVRDEVRASGRSTEGLDWQRALDSGMLELVREGRLAEAKELLLACLSSSSA